MKIKYYRLSKEERKEYRDKYYATSKGKILKKNTAISYVTSILLLIYSIYSYIDTYINHLSKWYYAYNTLLLVISIIMIISIHNLRIRAINNYIIKK